MRVRRRSGTPILLTCTGVLFALSGCVIIAFMLLVLPTRSSANASVAERLVQEIPTVAPAEQPVAPVAPAVPVAPFTPSGEEFALRVTQQTFDSPEELLQVLQNYNSGRSPAARIEVAAAWLQTCEEYQVDCGFIVAKFIWESGAGTNESWVGYMPEGGISHNVGNIICAGYDTCFADSDGRSWRRYPNWEEGGKDAIKLLYVYASEGCPARPEGPIPNIRRAIQCWAPAGDGDNSPSTYADFVERVVRKWRQNDFSF